MSEEQPNLPVTPETLVAEVQARRDQGWRLVQIGVTTVGESYEVNYSFDREQRFCNLRLTIPAAGARLPSVSGAYWCSFLYENEIHDLFGVAFDGLAVDFKGRFYQTAVRHPFAPAAPGVSASVVAAPV